MIVLHRLTLIPPGNGLSNRELAIGFWLLVLIAVVLIRADMRGTGFAVVRSLFQRVLLLSIAALLAWIVLVVIIGARLGLWTSDLLKDTAIWFLTFGLVRLFRLTNVGKDRHLFQETIVDPLKATAIVEFITNLYVFPLLGEIVLIPVATVLSLVTIVPAQKSAIDVKRFANVALGMIGFVVLVFSGIELVRTWSTIDFSHQLRLFLLPIWLTVGTVPYLYFMSLLAGYEAAFLRIRWASAKKRVTFRSIFAMFSVLHIRTRAVANFRAPWIGRLADAESLAEAKSVLADYLRNAA